MYGDYEAQHSMEVTWQLRSALVPQPPRITTPRGSLRVVSRGVDARAPSGVLTRRRRAQILGLDYLLLTAYVSPAAARFRRRSTRPRRCTRRGSRPQHKSVHAHDGEMGTPRSLSRVLHVDTLGSGRPPRCSRHIACFSPPVFLSRTSSRVPNGLAQRRNAPAGRRMLRRVVLALAAPALIRSITATSSTIPLLGLALHAAAHRRGHEVLGSVLLCAGPNSQMCLYFAEFSSPARAPHAPGPPRRARERRGSRRSARSQARSRGHRVLSRAWAPFCVRAAEGVGCVQSSHVPSAVPIRTRDLRGQGG